MNHETSFPLNWPEGRKRTPNAGGTDQEWLELQEAYGIAKQVCK